MMMINLSQLECWGNNEQGQTDVPLEVNFKSALVSSGGAHTCAARKVGTDLYLDLNTESINVACWGSDR